MAPERLFEVTISQNPDRRFRMHAVDQDTALAKILDNLDEYGASHEDTFHFEDLGPLDRRQAA